MSRSFDYRIATSDDIATHLNTVQLQAYSRARLYYEGLGDTGMVKKLERAKIIARILKLCEKLEEFDADNGEVG